MSQYYGTNVSRATRGQPRQKILEQIPTIQDVYNTEMSSSSQQIQEGDKADNIATQVANHVGELFKKCVSNVIEDEEFVSTVGMQATRITSMIVDDLRARIAETFDRIKDSAMEDVAEIQHMLRHEIETTFARADAFIGNGEGRLRELVKKSIENFVLQINLAEIVPTSIWGVLQGFKVNIPHASSPQSSLDDSTIVKEAQAYAGASSSFSSASSNFGSVATTTPVNV